MTTNTPNMAAGLRADGAGPLPTFEALRARHVELSRRLASHDEPPEFWDDVEQLLRLAGEAGVRIRDDEDRAAAQAILNQWANTLFRERHIDVDAVLADYADTAPPRDLDDAACPYPGLAPFDEVRRDVYVGRWRLIDEAVTKLAELGATGASGSCSSSACRAPARPR